MPAVQVTDLTVRYGPAGSAPAVDGLNLSAELGQVLVVLGPNGAGKTSTIESLEGYRRPSGGLVRVLDLNPIADHRALTGRIGVMLQKGGVYPMLGPRRVLDLFRTYYPDPMGTDALLDLVSLRDVATTPWRHLSGGEQQRLSLALALIGRPQVAFLDEPTAGVDPQGRQAIRAVVAELRSQGVCVLLTTHELPEAEKMADRIIILAGGRIVLEGTPLELTGAAAGAGLSFGAPAGLDVEALAGAIGPGAVVREVTPGRYKVEGAAGPGVTAAVATWLAGQGADLTDLSTGRSLEDVYFDAVGAEAEVGLADDGSGGTGTATDGGRGRRGRSRRANR
jgi:ABC-2 type transport system ATP-binding protein